MHCVIVINGCWGHYVINWRMWSACDVKVYWPLVEGCRGHCDINWSLCGGEIYGQTTTAYKYFWFKYDLGQKYYAPKVRPDWGFKLMTSRSWQYTSYHWHTCSNHSTISDFYRHDRKNCIKKYSNDSILTSKAYTRHCALHNRYTVNRGGKNHSDVCNSFWISRSSVVSFIFPMTMKKNKFTSHMEKSVV